MSDRSNPSGTPANEQPPRKKRGRAFLIATLMLAAGLTGAAVTKAVSNPHGFGPGGWHHRFSAANVEDRADRMVRHFAVEIDASAEQQEKLRGIMRGAVKDVLPAHEKAHAARLQARELLSQPTINRAEIEKFRAEQIGLADAVSKRIAQAIGDAAEVLTAEQRKKLNDRFPPFGGYWHGGRRG